MSPLGFEPAPVGFEPSPDDSLRGRLIRGAIWFALSIMPADVEFPEITADRPHAIVEDHGGPLLDVDEMVRSLRSAP